MTKEFFGVVFRISEKVKVTEGLLKRLKAFAVDCERDNYFVCHNEEHELVIV